jgi:hypothetical protein
MMNSRAATPRLEEPIGSDIASARTYPADRPSRHGVATSDPSALDTSPRLSKGEALIAISLISLGLWAVVVAIVRALAWALLP